MRTDETLYEEGQGSLAARARRAQIIQAAAEVVAELGYAHASVARIAERAGISKGVITYHFDNKDQILRLVAQRLFDRCRQHIKTRIGRASSAAEQIRDWIRAELEFFAAHRTEFIAMIEVMDNHREPDFSHAFEAEVAAEISQLASLLAQGQRSGEFRNFDTDHVAGIIYHGKNGVLDSWAHHPDLELSAHVDSLLDFIDHATAGKQRA